MSIASLLPSATRIVCDLGLHSSLLAVSHDCETPAEIAGLPVLTRTMLDVGLNLDDLTRRARAAARRGLPLYHVRAEVLADLAPRLIVSGGPCEVWSAGSERTALLSDVLPPGGGGRLLELGGRTLTGILADVRAVAEAADVPERGAALAEQATARWMDIPRSRLAPRVLTLEWTGPPMSGGDWIPEQVERAGGVNVFGRAGQPSRLLSWPEIEASDPDVVVVMCGCAGLRDNVGFASTLLRHPGASRVRAVRQGRLWATDAASFHLGALSVVRGAEVLAALLRGEALPGESVRVLLS